jgi:hypothetical protein
VDRREGAPAEASTGSRGQRGTLGVTEGSQGRQASRPQARGPEPQEAICAASQPGPARSAAAAARTSAAASCQASLISQRPVAALTAMVSVLRAAAAAALAASAGRHYGQGEGQADKQECCCVGCCGVLCLGCLWRTCLCQKSPPPLQSPPSSALIHRPCPALCCLLDRPPASSRSARWMLLPPAPFTTWLPTVPPFCASMAVC